MLKILRGKYDDQIISERLYSPELTEIVQVIHTFVPWFVVDFVFFSDVLSTVMLVNPPGKPFMTRAVVAQACLTMDPAFRPTIEQVRFNSILIQFQFNFFNSIFLQFELELIRHICEQLLSREMVVAKAAELQIVIPERVAQVPPHSFYPRFSAIFLRVFTPFYPRSSAIPSMFSRSFLASWPQFPESCLKSLGVLVLAGAFEAHREAAKGQSIRQALCGPERPGRS